MRASCTRLVLLVFAAVAGACGGSDDGVEGGDKDPIHPTLGQLIGLQNPEGVSYTVIADREDGLSIPRDLSFHPGREGEAWIVNRRDDSVTIVFDATTDAVRTEHRIDGLAMHFMEEVSSISFGAKNYRDDWTFGTCQESENTYNGQEEPNFFSGPTLWSADLEVFAVENPIGLGSHLDMLHHSPNCMGIAHELDNVYWVFDGYNGQIVRYDFQKDHDAGYDDHADGIIRFLEEPKVVRVPGIPSHLEFDKATGLLYVADTGNGRVLRIDTTTGVKARDIPLIEHGNVVEEWSGIVWTELVPATRDLLQSPSGIVVHAETLYVGDFATGKILAFDLEGKHIGTLDTGLGRQTLMGLEAGPDDRLYIVDAGGSRVLRIER